MLLYFTRQKRIKFEFLKVQTWSTAEASAHVINVPFYLKFKIQSFFTLILEFHFTFIDL